MHFRVAMAVWSKLSLFTPVIVYAWSLSLHKSVRSSRLRQIIDLPQAAGSQVQLQYTKVVSKVNDVVGATESLEAEEPLEEPVMACGTLSATGTRSLTVKPYRGGEAAEPQTLTVKDRPYIHGGKYC